MAANKKGKITKQIGAYPNLSEQIVADIFAEASFYVEFIAEDKGHKRHPADIYMEGLDREIKCIESDKMDKVRQNLNKALKQSKNIILGTFNTDILDGKIINYAAKYVKSLKTIKKMKIINRKKSLI